MRAAITLRRRDIVTVVPRSGDTATGAAERCVVAAAGADVTGAATGELTFGAAA